MLIIVEICSIWRTIDIERTNMIETPNRKTLNIRRPVQQRSRNRFEVILDHTELLLEKMEPSMIGVHMIAADLEVSAQSIYHFFPAPPLIFEALAERYLAVFEQRADSPPTVAIDTWQDLQTYRFGRVREYFNTHTPARKVLLGSALSSDIHRRDLDSTVVMAQKGIDETARLFELPPIPDLLDRSAEVIAISDAIWALSIHRHGYITDAMEEQARRARIAYTRTYLPEYLTRKTSAAQ